MTQSKRTLSLLTMCLASSLALGQNADKNSGGPTRNDYHLRVLEPMEGAIVAGTQVQVSVNLEIPGVPSDARKDVETMPQPEVGVFLDNERKGTLKGAVNVLTLNDVTPGKHTLVLVALNRSNEIIDRKEIGFESTAANGSAVAPAPMTAVQPAVANTQTVPAASIQPAAMPATKASRSPEPAPAPAPAAAAEPTTPRHLPKTGTGYPVAAGAGLALVLTGFVLRRRV
jgi:LPXTG-motif cell wall-anchored protein